MHGRATSVSSHRCTTPQLPCRGSPFLHGVPDCARLNRRMVCCQQGMKSLVSLVCVVMVELGNENKHYQP